METVFWIITVIALGSGGLLYPSRLKGDKVAGPFAILGVILAAVALTIAFF